MTIIQKINAAKARKAEVVERAKAELAKPETTAEVLNATKAELREINNEIAQLEELREAMGDDTKPVNTPKGDPNPKEASLGEILQQAAAREFASNGIRIRGVTLNAGTPSGQNEGSDEDGGHLLSPTISRDLLKSVREGSRFLSRVRPLNVGPDSNSIKLPYITDKNRTEGKRFGGVRAYWLGEAEEYTPSRMKFGTRDIQLAKLGALGFATEEMLRDSQYIESIMRDAFANEMTWQVDEAILFGLGTRQDENLQPTGMLNGAAQSGNAALITVAKESGQAAASLAVQNILKMWNRMSPENRSRAEWHINPDIEILLMQMLMQTGTIDAGDAVVAQGTPIYMPPNGLAAAPYGTIFGRPVVPNEHMSAAGQVGDIAFIDSNEYYWIDQDGMKQTTSIHVRFVFDEMAFKFTYRCNGTPTWYEPTTPAKGGTTRSPYVVLGAR